MYITLLSLPQVLPDICIVAFLKIFLEKSYSGLHACIVSCMLKFFFFFLMSLRLALNTREHFYFNSVPDCPVLWGADIVVWSLYICDMGIMSVCIVLNAEWQNTSACGYWQSLSKKGSDWMYPGKGTFISGYRWSTKTLDCNGIKWAKKGKYNTA